MKAYMKNRDLIVYGLLEKPVKAKDRKKLLKILKETAMGKLSKVLYKNTIILQRNNVNIYYIYIYIYFFKNIIFI